MDSSWDTILGALASGVDDELVGDGPRPVQRERVEPERPGGEAPLGARARIDLDQDDVRLGGQHSADGA
jgi:hypothetical protein